jgi:hypothetical protein
VTDLLVTRFVMVGLIPTNHPSTGSGACGGLDRRDKPEDDSGNYLIEAEH